METTWTGRGEDGEAGAAVASGLEAGVVSDFVVDVESSGAAGVGITLEGNTVVVTASGGAVELVAVGGEAGTEGQEAEGAWDWAGRGGATPGGDVAGGGTVVPVSSCSVRQSGCSALLVLEVLSVVLVGGMAGGTAGGTVSTTGSLLTPGFDRPGVAALGTPCLAFSPSLTGSGAVAESFRGRPRLRFGESVRFPSSAGEVGCKGGVTVLSGSANLGGVFGGRPLFRFTGTRELTPASDKTAVPSLPGADSVRRAWPPPLPLPAGSCCSLSWAAILDSVSSLRRTGRFLSTGMSGERCGRE